MNCPMCGSTDVIEENRHDVIQYGDWSGVYDGPRAEIPVVVPVMSCVSPVPNVCGFQWTDYRADDIRTAAIEAFIPNPRQWIVEHSIRRGVEQAERGELTDNGSFAQYAQEEDE